MKKALVVLLPLLMADAAWGLNLTIVNPTVNNGLPFQLVGSQPYDREEVSAPAKYVLQFSQPVKPDRSYIRVLDSFGGRVNDDRITSDGMSLTAELPALPPGRYTVRWRTYCRCAGERDLSDTFHFTVK